MIKRINNIAISAFQIVFRFLHNGEVKLILNYINHSSKLWRTFRIIYISLLYTDITQCHQFRLKLLLSIKIILLNVAVEKQDTDLLQSSITINFKCESLGIIQCLKLHLAFTHYIEIWCMNIDNNYYS